MDIRAQRITFWILCVVGTSIPFVVLAISMLSSSPFDPLGKSQVFMLRFFASSDAIDEIWKIILPLATTMVTKEYLRRQSVWEQVGVLMIFFLCYLSASFSVSVVQTAQEALNSETIDGVQLAKTLEGIGQYCITVVVLMLGIKGTGAPDDVPPKLPSD